MLIVPKSKYGLIDMTLSETQDYPWTDEELSPIRDKVCSYLKNAILRGELKAGDRLVERSIAEKLNISRTPVREALFRLESQRFVSTVPRKGVVVNEISKDEILGGAFNSIIARIVGCTISCSENRQGNSG